MGERSGAAWLIALGMVASVTLGFGAGRASAPEPDALLRRLDRQEELLASIQTRLAHRPERAGASASAAGLDAASLKADLVQAVREAVKAQPPAPRDAPPTTEEPSEESRQAAARAERLIDSARSAREWSEPQAHELRKLLGLMTQAQSAPLLRTLVRAVNDGELTLPPHGQLF